MGIPSQHVWGWSLEKTTYFRVGFWSWYPFQVQGKTVQNKVPNVWSFSGIPIVGSETRSSSREVRIRVPTFCCGLF